MIIPGIHATRVILLSLLALLYIYYICARLRAVVGTNY